MNLINLVAFLVGFITSLSAMTNPSHVIELNDQNFSALTSNARPNEKWVIKLYTTFCSACSQLAPVYEELAQQVNEEDSSFNFAEVNIEDNNALSMKFFITRVPTLVMIKNGKAYDLSEVPRNLESLKYYLVNKQFEDQKPISGFFNPFGIIATSFFYLGQLVNKLKKLSKVAPNWVLLSIPSILIFVGFYFIFKPPQHVIDRRRPITMPNTKTSVVGNGSKGKIKKLK